VRTIIAISAELFWWGDSLNIARHTCNFSGLGCVALGNPGASVPAFRDLGSITSHYKRLFSDSTATGCTSCDGFSDIFRLDSSEDFLPCVRLKMWYWH
jgi:hypothetical protein